MVLLAEEAVENEYLSKFDLHVTYIPACYNTVADALSHPAYRALQAYSSEH